MAQVSYDIDGIHQLAERVALVAGLNAFNTYFEAL